MRLAVKSGRHPADIKNAILTVNDSYCITYLLLFSAIVPSGFNFDLDAKNSALDTVFLGFHVAMSYNLFFSIITCHTVSATLSGCANQNVVAFVSGAGRIFIKAVQDSLITMILWMHLWLHIVMARYLIEVIPVNENNYSDIWKHVFCHLFLYVTKKMNYHRREWADYGDQVMRTSLNNSEQV